MAPRALRSLPIPARLSKLSAARLPSLHVAEPDDAPVRSLQRTDAKIPLALSKSQISILGEDIMSASYFADIEPIKFEGLESTNPLAYRYYDKNRVVMGKTMAGPSAHGGVLLAHILLGWL